MIEDVINVTYMTYKFFHCMEMLVVHRNINAETKERLKSLMEEVTSEEADVLLKWLYMTIS